MSLKQYIAETEKRMSQPDQGDSFAIELEDGTLLETYVLAVKENAILLDATEKIVSVLNEWNYIADTAGEVLLEGVYNEEVEEVEESDYSDEQQPQDSGEYDYEGDMAKDDLYTIIRAARRLTGMLDDNENMPEWVQSKINKAADYVDTAADYIESNKQRAEDEQDMAEGEMDEAKYQGREVPLGKPMRGDVKKFKVYVRDPKSGNIKKVNFGHGGTSAKRAGQKTMKIKKSNPARRRSFRARHNCDNPGPRTSARYWSCRAW